MERIRDRLKYQLTLRLFLEDKSFGPGPMRLLEGVERTGSLNRAAGDMGMAYSKAWKLIHELEKEWGFALIVTRAGGAHGGGSHLTEEGKDLLERYRNMLADVNRAAETAFETYFPE